MSLSHPPRRRRSVTVAALLAGVVAGLVAPLVTLAPAEAGDVHVRRAFFGLHDGSLLAHSRLHEGSVRLWDVGVQWRDIETSPGVYDWSRLDEVVSSAQAAHEKVTMVVAMTPSFYAKLPTDPPRKLSHYRAFVSALMHRYRTFNHARGISSYQVWNEANISTFWTGSMRQMAKLSKIVVDVGRRVDPKATVVSPPMVTRLQYQLDYLTSYYATRLNGTPVWKLYDSLAFSLYTVPTVSGRAAGPEETMAQLRQVKGLLRRDHVPASKPLWNSEINYGLQTGSLGGTRAATISEARQASYVARTYLLNAAAGLKRVFWYRYDLGALSTGGTIANTLLTRPGDPATVTPAGRAFVRVQKWMHGTLIGSHGRAPCATDRHGTYTCVVRDSSGSRRIYWNPRHAATVHLAANARHAQGVLGTVSRVRPHARLTVGYRPVMVGR